MPYLIDGYNLYHEAAKFDEELAHIAPSTICRFVHEDMLRLRDYTTIVFDGTRPRGLYDDTEKFNRIKILFSGPMRDADTLIEKLIIKNTAPKRLTIISTDRRIRKAAQRRRCTALRSRDYLSELFHRQTLPPPPPPEPPEKRHGVPDGELNIWLELFGLDSEIDNEPDIPDDLMNRIRY